MGLALVQNDPQAELDEHRRLIQADDAYRERHARLWRCLPLRAATQANASTSARFQVTAAIASLRDWYDADDGNLGGGIAILAGPPGTGKTVAACWLAFHRLLRNEDRIRFVSAMELARLPRYGAAAKRRDVLLRGAGNATIIDDLGAEQVPRASANAWRADFDELVDAIYRNNGTAVITTNCSSTAFAKRYGARVCDRLAECGTWIPVVGKSMRGAK